MNFGHYEDRLALVCDQAMRPRDAPAAANLRYLPDSSVGIILVSQPRYVLDHLKMPAKEKLAPFGE